MSDPARDPAAIATTPKVNFTKTIDSSVLKDQSVLVTGGASGIGEGYSDALALAGAYVTIVDVSEERGDAKAKELTEKGYKVQFVKGDVRSWDDQIRAFESAIAFSPHKSIDIVLAVAGVSGKNIHQWLDNSTSPDGKPIPPDMRCIDVNLTGAMYTMHLALHYFRQSIKTETRSVPSKQLVIVSSLAGFTAHQLITDYAGSKWGIRGAWRSIRDQPDILDPESAVKFRTSLIAPWYVRTNITEKIMPGMLAKGIKFASMDQCVDGLFRIICDEEVKGRAVAIGPDVNVDLCDDYEGYEAGREWPGRLVDGTFGDYKAIASFFEGRSRTKSLAAE